MAGLPTSLAIGLWLTGACWLIAIIAYVLEIETTVVAPLMVLGVATGTAEWLLRRND
jgi:hypothetical protein